MQNSNLPSVVSLDSCQQLLDTCTPFILVPKEGESLFSVLAECAKKINLKSAYVTGLGSIKDVTVAFYNHKTYQQQAKLFAGIFEIGSLTGTITQFEGTPFIHLHAAIGDESYQLYGGHVVDAFAGAATELAITPLNSVINRKFDSTLGIKRICIPEAK